MSMGALVLEQLREDVGGVAEQPDRQGAVFVAGCAGPADRVVDVVGLLVQVAELDPPRDPGLVARRRR